MDEAGAPVGEPTNVARELAARRNENDRRYWTAKFTLNVIDHDYLGVSGTWRDEERCGGDQSADWTFHLSAE